MATRRNKRVKKSNRSTESSSAVFVLTDNVSRNAASSLTESSSINFSAESLGLDQSIDDATLLKKFSNVVTSIDTTATSIILTQDMGKRDGIMPAEIIKLQKSGRKIIKISTRIKGKSNQDIAYGTLSSIHYFKKPETYGDRFLDIHLGKDGKSLVVHYKRTNGKTGIRRQINVFEK